MNNFSLLNKERPLIFCPGCSHEQIVHALDKSFIKLGLSGTEIVIVTDIGCSGLFDTFFNTHTMHGLHGRALTYATGIKMANPKLNVIVTMGDGGIGIGGAHFLAACKRNLNLTLLILNNFNFGMTGGQFSPTTPNDAQTNSGFLNQLEKPINICKIAEAAGATYIVESFSYKKNLSEEISSAIAHKGMSIIDIHGICPGRFSKNNKLSPETIKNNLLKNNFKNGVIKENIRIEYRKNYEEKVKNLKKQKLIEIDVQFKTLKEGRHEIIILGSAGQRIITAGEILCLAALSSGLSAIQKNDYPITVLRGHSISNIILSTKEIGYQNIKNPNIILAIGKEGIERKSSIFKKISSKTLIILDSNLKIPNTKATIKKIDFKSNKINQQNKAISCLVLLSKLNLIINDKMLKFALEKRFNKKIIKEILKIIDKTEKIEFTPIIK